MSGETERNISGWTVDTLHAHIVAMFDERDHRYSQRFAAQEQANDDRDAFLERLALERDKQVAAAFNAANEAVRKAEVAAEKRFDAVNEFRGQLADQARDFMPRKEAELQISSLTDRVIAQEKLASA